MAQPIASTGVDSGKRAQAKRQNQRMILDAAREVFCDLGYEAASVRDIIRRSGLSVGAFYNYYRSKEEVYEALADDGVRRFQPVLQALREAAVDFETYIRGAISAYFRFLADEHEAGLAHRPPGETFPMVRKHTPQTEAAFKQVRGAITEALARQETTPVDADYLAAACIAIAQEIGEKMLYRRPMDIGGAVEFTVRMILGGLPALPFIRG